LPTTVSEDSGGSEATENGAVAPTLEAGERRARKRLSWASLFERCFAVDVAFAAVRATFRKHHGAVRPLLRTRHPPPFPPSSLTEGRFLFLSFSGCASGTTSARRLRPGKHTTQEDP
jgi:hypothetical protein